MADNVELRGGMSQAEALAVQGMLKAMDIQAELSRTPNPNFRIKNPYPYQVLVPRKDVARAEKLLHVHDRRILQKHKSMIVLRSGDIGEVPERVIRLCPECGGPASDPPVRGGAPKWTLAPPAIVLGSAGAWFLHHPARGNAGSYLLAGAFAVVWSALAYVPLLLLFARGTVPRNHRFCARCNREWDLEDYVDGEEAE